MGALPYEPTRCTRPQSLVLVVHQEVLEAVQGLLGAAVGEETRQPPKGGGLDMWNQHLVKIQYGIIFEKNSWKVQVGDFCRLNSMVKIGLNFWEF